MGDMIEMTTWPSHHNVFYRMSSNGVIFEVKGEANAAIGLAKKPGNVCDVWVVIGHDQCTWIKKREGGRNAVRTPNILNNREYRRFWLSWRSGSIQLGRSHDRTPIIAHPIPNSMDLCYVTFSSGGGGLTGRNPVHWRVELPPVLEKPKMKSVTNGELRWVRADDPFHLPDGALIGGYEKEILYIIRAHHEGSLTPGKFIPSQGTGYIAWSWGSYAKNEFEVLCGFDCAWVPCCDDRIPVGAVEGGYSEIEPGEKNYVGRALHYGHLIPGKVQASQEVCCISFDNRVKSLSKFEILVSPSDVSNRCANRLFIDQIDLDKTPPEFENCNNDPEDVYPLDEFFGDPEDVYPLVELIDDREDVYPLDELFDDREDVYPLDELFVED